MERVLSVDERIKRAEDIYYRRKNGVNEKQEAKKESIFTRRIVLQILICLVLFAIFYMIKTTNYVFSEAVISKANEIINYDYDFLKVYMPVKDYVSNIFKSSNEEENENKNEEENIEESNNEPAEENVQADENIGGEDLVNTLEESQNLSQMEQDAKYILDNKSLIIPLSGTITSRFGTRESTNPIVSKNHTGIDIAVDEGTEFISSMSGTVKEVSSGGALGKHVEIENGDVSTVYAHCKSIYVQEGQKVNQGEPIGEVGITGNTTGPHLHFEIKKEDRYVDPDLVLEFE